MRNGIQIVALCLILFTNANAQRYLTNVFPEIDSIIGGTYGFSVNVQSENQELLFDFYEPSEDSETSRPLLIYIHGGGFTSGTRDYPSIKMMCREMAHKGYTVATISYRLDPDFEFYNSNTDRRAMTDAMHDAKQAIRYFKANADQYRVDTSKVFIGGESAGAVTAMMASYLDKQNEMLPYPMAVPNDPIGNDSNLEYSNNVAGTLCLCGTTLDTLAMESPDDPPLLWIHGTEDSFIPISFAFTVVLRALHIGIPIQTLVFEGGVHCPWFYGNPNWETYLDSTITEVTSFLYPMVISTSVKENITTTIENVYPNPTTGRLINALDKAYNRIKTSILSVEGDNIYQLEFRNRRTVTLDLNVLERGVYIVRIQIAGQVINRKIIKI